MRNVIRGLLALCLIAGLLVTGAFAMKHMQSEFNEASASGCLVMASNSDEARKPAETVFFVGCATALSRSPHVLFESSELLIRAKEFTLARELLDEALSKARESNPALVPRIERRLLSMQGRELTK